MENKNNISKEDFLKLLNSDEPVKMGELDDFEKEALEGLKLMKNPFLVNSIDEKIDKKLDELVAEEKKGRNKGSLYFLAIAASIALIIGLFFIFKQTENDLTKNVALVDETKSDSGNQPPEDASIQSNSDGNITPEKSEKNLEQTLTTGENYKTESLSNGLTSPVTTVAENQNQPDLNKKTKNSNGFLGIKDGEGTIVSGTTSKKDVILEKGNNNKYTMTVDEVRLEDERKSNAPKETIYSKNEAKAKDNFDVVESKNIAEAETNEKVVLNEDAKVVIEQDREKKTEEEAAKKKAKSDKDIASNKRSETPAITDNLALSNTGSGTVTPPSVSAGVVNSNSTVSTGALSPAATTSVAVPSGSTNYVTAEFVGGQKALDNYIKANLKIPESCLSEEVIVIRFDVSASGEISKSKILSKTGNCKDCEKEAHAFVKQMPNWKPATSNGKAIASTQQITLSFKK